MTEYPRLHEPFALDIETYDPHLKTLGPGPRRGDGRILGVSIATEDREWWLPMNDHTREWLRTHDHLDTIGANISYDLDWLQYETYIPSGRAWDVQVAEALLDEYKPTYSLDSLAKEYLGIGKETTEIDAWCSERGLKGDSRKHLYLMPEELVAKYAKIDVRRTYDVFQIQKKRIAEQGLDGIFELETDLLPMLMQMRRRGVRIDEGQLERNIITAQDLLKTEQLSLNREAGFDVNVNAARQLVQLFDKLHLDYPRTDKGNPSFTAAFLESMEHPIAEKILRIRHLFKLDSTFLTGYKRFIVNGRIHPLFHPTRNGFGGTVSGRFSCVRGDTEILTNRGIFKIEHYTPKPGDHAFTHKKRWRPIKRKILKGVDKMYRIVLSSGQEVTCTLYHKIWDGSRFISVKDLKVGMEVPNVHMQEGCREPRGSKRSSFSVYKPREANHKGYHQDHKVFVPYNIKNTARSFTCGAVKRRAKTSLFQDKSRKTEPYDRKIRSTTSKVERELLRWERVFNSDMEGEAPVCSSNSNGPGYRYQPLRSAGRDGCSPHRWRHIKQRSPQFGFGQQRSTWEVAQEKAKISRIDFVGTIHVWDLEVEEDHSYLANGMFHHNSSAPNMQQLPSRDPVIKNLTRGLFIPEEGMQFFKMDYSSVEYRAFAHYAQGPGADKIRQEYADNPRLDYHQMTADIAGVTRSLAKTANFMILFGGGVDKTALMLNLPREKASQFLSQYHSRLPFIKTTTKTVQQVWQQRGFIRSILGRQFRYDGKGYTGANRLTQSFGADLIKRAMVRAYREGLTESLFISLQVHDELSGSFGSIEDLKKLKEIMEYSPESKVPILADAETGPNWAEVKEIVLI